MRFCVWCNTPERDGGPYWTDNEKRDSQTVIGVNNVGKKVEICVVCRGPAQYYYGDPEDRPTPRRKGKRKW